MKKALAIFFVFSAPLAAAFAAPAKPIEATVGEFFKNPIGYSLEGLSFSWKLPAEEGVFGTRQTAYRIVVAKTPDGFEKGAVWDSGKVESDKSVFVPYGGKPPAPRERLYWRVRYWDENGGESEWSDTNFFEAGLLKNSDWSAKWISAKEPRVKRQINIDRPKWKSEISADYVPCAYFRREFDAGKKIASARLYVASRGLFEFYVNGKKVGDEFWGTGWTDYNIRIQANTYDITKMLRRGENTLAAVIGDGWFSGRIGWKPNKRGLYGDRPELLAPIEITYEDGTTAVVATDESWKSSFGPIITSASYDGETYDARLEMGGWNENGFDGSSWKTPNAKPVGQTPLIEPRRNQPIRVKDVLVPVAVKKIGAGKYVFDMGQNMVGWAKIRVPSEKNRTYKIGFSEMLDERGEPYKCPYRSCLSEDSYTSAGGVMTDEWQPKFTYHGFRYVELSGVPEGAKPDLDWVRGIVLHNDMPQIGAFVCDRPKINALQSCVRWGMRGNFFSVPTDCPQRDERLGWTGDATAFAPTAAFNMDVSAFYAKWSLDMRDAQRRDGNMPFICPDILGGINGGPCWGDAIVVIPYETYLAFGDVKILADNYAAMKKWVDYQLKTAKDFIRPEIGFGDWLQPNAKKMTGDTPKSLIATAYFAYTAGVVAECAKILGKKEDAVSYAKLSEDVKKAFNARFVKPDGSVESGAQTAYALPLNLGVILPEMREKVFAKFVEKLERDNFTLSTGFVGTPHLNPALSAGGRSDIAYKLLLNKNYPSWLYPITQGATTMWERWNSYTRESGFGDANMNSFNHYAYGAVGQWLYKDVGGLWHAAPGYSKILFAPSPTESLSSVSVWHETPYGRASSSWTLAGGVFDWAIEIPPNSEGVVICKTKLPDTVLVGGNPPQNASKTSEGYPTFTLKSGAHKISFKIK